MLAEEQLIGNYRIVSLIDRAQFNVYRAIDSSGREVAIKSLGAYSNTNDVQRQSFVAKDTITLVEEADILKKLNHSNIVGFVELFLLDETGLVMEYLDGPNLDQYVETFGKLTEENAVEYARQTADALSYIHSLNPSVIHGDVKPKNIVVLSKEKIKLVDFGSSATPESFTEVYAPKERRRYGKNSTLSDVYSLGWTIYFCLSGKDPRLRKVESRAELKKLRISKRLKQLLFSAVEDDEVYRPSAVEFLRELAAV